MIFRSSLVVKILMKKATALVLHGRLDEQLFKINKYLTSRECSVCALSAMTFSVSFAVVHTVTVQAE